MPGELTRGVRVGYGLGSVATGAFGTVPGLLLLPYLTDTLGVAAAVAGVVVFLPKAWDVLLNPVAGRISDRHVSPAGPRRPFLLRAGVALAICFALLFAGPPLGSTALETAYVVLLFLACATAYAFFQVPFVAMPAEITDSYEERTRLLSWRVALLALTILVSGASAPAIRDALGGHAGYRAMGLLRRRTDPPRHHRGVRRHAAGTGRDGQRRRGKPHRAAPDRRARPRLPHAADHVRPAGPRDRVDAGRRRLRRAQRPGQQGRLDVPLPLLRRTGPPAHAGVGGGRRTDRQEGGVRRCVAVPRGRRGPARPGAAGAAGRGLRRHRAGRDRLRRGPGVPAVDARRRRSRGRGDHRARTAPASSPASGPPGRRSGSPWVPGSSGWSSPQAGTSRPRAAEPPSRTRRSPRSCSASRCSRQP